jgi:hypothetical protein
VQIVDHQHVVAGAALELVHAGAAIEQIVAAAAPRDSMLKGERKRSSRYQ